MYISVDMGGTNTRVAGAIDLIDFDLVTPPIKHKNTGDYEQDLQFIIDSANRLRGRYAISAVGIGTPGTPNSDRTRIASAINLPQWNDQPLCEPIEQALNCPVYYGNDGEAGALGHAYYDAHDDTDFHYLIWGTGIGGASITHDEAGGVEHVKKLHWESHFREWEKACSGSSLAKRYGQAPESFSDKRWRHILREFGAHMITYVNTYNPPMIVFGGGLAEKHQYAIYDAGITARIDTAINKNSIYGGFGLIRFAQEHGLPLVDAADVEE